MKKVISFSLYGSKATYIIGMKENIKLAKQHFSDWEVIIYHNNTVPENYINEYKELDAICILCKNIGENKLNWEGMFWRWLPLDDPEVDIWISRDADSRLSEREAKIVDEWINSGKTLHSIRDHRCHFNYIMGGMFGINNKLFHEKYKFKTVSQIIKELSVNYKERSYNVDQIFLNDKLWNLLKNDMMAHISKDGRRVYSSDILIPSVPDFIGKQYRLNDFPENIIKYLDKNKGCYWKESTSQSVYWSISSIDIKPDVKFNNQGEYFMHRVEHGFPQNWSQIQILDGINIDEKPKEIETKIDINENNFTEFDKIIIIHLNKLKDRKENILKQINKLSNVVIIDAIDKDLLDINDLKEKNLIGYPGNDYCKNINKCWCTGRGHNDMMRIGRIACSWSHSLVYNYIISNDIQNALIFEDDFLLSDNFDIIIKDIKYNLPKDYDLIYFAHSKKKINNYTHHNKYFKKIFTGLSETVCYSITKNTAIKLLENLFPIRAAADGYIRQSIDYLKTIKNVYVCKNDLCKNLSLSIESNINTTIDINNKLEINNNLKLKNGCLNNYFNNKTSKSDILLVTGYWKIKNKYDSEKYSEWASNTLQLENDMCIFYEDRDFLDLCINIRKNKICKTYYIYRDINDFYSNNIISDSINCTYNVVSIPLARVYSEKVKLLQIAKNRYNNYEWLGWIDIGNPIYRNNIPNQLVLTNVNILDKNKINCNHTHFNYNTDIILKLANNVYDKYYHYIAGTGYIINKNKINEYVKIFYDQQTIMSNYKNKINNSLILDDQCIWTQIYSKKPELFNIISGKYGEIYNTISQKYILYKQPYSYCGLGNQLLLLIYNLYSYKNNLIKFKLNRDLFNIDNLITKYICLHSDKDNKINECSKNIFNDNNLLDNNELQKVYIQCLKNLEIDTINYDIYDTVIHIRSFYNNDDKYYYLQPTLLYYDYIFNNFNLGKDILLVYGLPKNPIVDIISKKYNIPIKTTSKVEDDLLIMKNCKNLIWDTSTLCWVESIMSTHNNHFIFGDYKKYIRSNTFVYSNNFINIKCNYDINRLSIKNMKLIDLFHTNNITNVSSNLKDNIDNNVNVDVNNSPLVSIAISTFESGGKGHELLKHNFDQIFKQDYENIEIVISDHSSDNKIKELCKEYDGKKYPIKYIHNPEYKGNSSQNTNNAIKYCNGEYIKILFMDDYLYNESAITIIVENFEKNIDKKWLVHSYKHTKDYKEFYNLHHPKFSHDIVFCNRIGTPSCLTIHNSVKERFDENLKWFMDSELYKRILDKYGQPIFLHTKEDIKPLMINLHHDEQVTNKSIDKDLIVKEKEYIINLNMKYMFPGKWQGPLSLNKVQFLFSTVGTNSDLSPVHNYCDWCIGYRWNKDKLFGDTNKLPTKIFIYQNSFKFFYNKIYPLIPKNHKYLIIIGDDDLTIPINYDERWNKDELMTLEMWEDITNNPQIKHIFATKLSIKQTNKYSPLPVGFNPAEFKNFSPDNLLDFKVNLDIRNKLLKVLYASRVRMHKERILIKNLCENSWSDFCDVKSNIDKNNFNDFIQNYSFMICDTGERNHIDPNPKLFTCLYLGVIPIIKKFVNCYEMYCDLPIMYIDDWDTNSISLEKLLHFRSKFEPYFYDSSKREKVLEKLSSEYWIKYIINKTNDKILVE